MFFIRFLFVFGLNVVMCGLISLLYVLKFCVVILVISCCVKWIIFCFFCVFYCGCVFEGWVVVFVFLGCVVIIFLFEFFFFFELLKLCVVNNVVKMVFLSFCCVLNFFRLLSVVWWWIFDVICLWF